MDRPLSQAHSTSSVISWLDNLCSPKSIHLQDISLKRKRAHQQNTPKKRIALAELPPTARSNARVMASSSHDLPTTRGRRQRIPHTPTGMKGKQPQDAAAEVEDVFATPRQIPVLAPSDASSNRSQSPSKMAELAGISGTGDVLKNLQNGLDDLVEEHPLFALLELLEEVERFSAGHGVVTEDLRNSIQDSRLSRREFRYAQNAFDTTNERRRYGSVPALADALDLVEETNACRQRQEPEPSWNCRCHYPILKAARRLSSHADTLEIANITTAKIHPKSLLPSWRSGAGLRSKLVDFAITLKPDPHLQHSYPNLEPLEEGLARSFNSTCLNTVLQEPIAISIETKTEDGHNNEAIMQLFTWSIAHLERLRILMQESGLEDAVLPALPLLSVHGGLWKIYAISWTEDKGYNLWYLFTCGSTDTPLGFYKVFAILQLLMHWADTVYRAWIRSVIPLTEEEVDTLGGRSSGLREFGVGAAG